jgi:hypothetical protein
VKEGHVRRVKRWARIINNASNTLQEQLKPLFQRNVRLCCCPSTPDKGASLVFGNNPMCEALHVINHHVINHLFGSVLCWLVLFTVHALSS